MVTQNNFFIRYDGRTHLCVDVENFHGSLARHKFSYFLVRPWRKRRSRSLPTRLHGESFLYHATILGNSTLLHRIVLSHNIRTVVEYLKRKSLRFIYGYFKFIDVTEFTGNCLRLGRYNHSIQFHKTHKCCLNLRSLGYFTKV